MIVLRLLRRLRGFVRFCATGAGAERFLNLLARQHISVWGLTRRGDTLTGFAYARDYPRLRPLAKKAGVRLRILQKQGAPFQKNKLKKRHGLLVGAGIFVVFLFVMTRFIWSIHIVGNERISQDAILGALEQAGIHPGVLRSGIDVSAVERQLMLELKDLGWTALNIDGSSLYVVINEAIPVPPNIDPRSPSNIVAAHSGQIIELRVYQGQPMFTRGDAVQQGQVIVSGITQDSFGQNLLRHARAQVIAEVAKEIELRVPLDQVAYEATGATARRGFLRILGLEAPLFLPRSIQRPYTIERVESPLLLLGIELPISYRSELFTLMKEVPMRFTEEQAMQRALHELEVAQAAQFGESVIVSRALHGVVAADEFVLHASYVVHIDIAQPQPIYIGVLGWEDFD